MADRRRHVEDPRSTDELIRLALAELLADDESAPRTRALSALHSRPTREVLDRAIELCHSANSAERRLGVIILAELYDPEIVPAPHAVFVEESMPVLLRLADGEPDIDVLVQVARAFGYRQDPRGVPPLLDWRDHPDQRMRFFVACSLRRCRTTDNESHLVSALVELTDDVDGAVRDYALFGLRELAVDGAEIRDAMVRRVRDPDRSTAGEALVGLAMLGDERGIEPLKEYLRDQHPQTRPHEPLPPRGRR